MPKSKVMSNLRSTYFQCSGESTSQKIFFALTFNSSLFLLLMVGIQNSTDSRKVNLILSQTVKLPIAFIIGVSFISGSLTGTILTNTFAAVVLIIVGLLPNSRMGKVFATPTVFGCVITSMLWVGIGFHVLLSDYWSPDGMEAVTNYLNHYIL